MRGVAPELGRDADTGGQVLYVLELARALASQAVVSQVDLATRLIRDETLSYGYAQPQEPLCDKARIIRVAAGGDEYLPKEELWDCLDTFVDNMVDHYRFSDSRPSLLHSHYADAGYVGSRLSHLLGIPLIHTGHSLGRVKRRRLLASGLTSRKVDKRYNMQRRIIAEEQTLASAARVVTSTRHEMEQQYGLYNFYRPEAMRVLPPGTDLSRFKPPQGGELESDIALTLNRFLQEPEKPMILALSRADPRKNITTLVHAYGGSALLRKHANLVIVIGNRGDISELEEGAQEVLNELLQLIDKYDLYGKVAYPKQHGSDDVPVLYRLAVQSRGVFVNPALTEPFGLTLIEAGASGLPIVATEDGGPCDIIGNCANGLLIDPLDPAEIADAILAIITSPETWQAYSAAGLRGVKQHYAWDAHAQHYLQIADEVLQENTSTSSVIRSQDISTNYINRALFTDLNRSLLGDPVALQQFIDCVRSNRARMKFGICTGLRLDAALKLLRRHQLPEPDVLITSTGTAISYAPMLTPDTAWTRHIEKQWTPQQVRRVLSDVPGIIPRNKNQQSRYRISYRYDPLVAPSVQQISGRLYKEEQSVNVIFSHGQFLNIVPLRASKGLAMRHALARFGIPLERTLAIGGSGADEDMMRGNALAAIVGNSDHHELTQVEQGDTIYFARHRHAAGILEAMDHYDFLGRCKAPAVGREIIQ